MRVEYIDFMNIEEKFKCWQMGKLTDGDMAAHFFLYYHELKYPNKKLKEALLNLEKPSDLLDKFVFKKVKSKALVALKKWCRGEWNLKLISTIPSPYEVLHYQALGIRPVTIKLQDELESILHKDDCLEFFLHDLEHAYMFFYDEDLKKMQTKFFKSVEKSLETDLWNSYLQDKEFKERFYYLISDMNTHEEHYRHYLNSMLNASDIEKFSFLFSKERV